MAFPFRLRLPGRVRQALLVARLHPRAGTRFARAGANCYLTCTGKRDRAGAQTLAVLSAMLFADRVGMRYVHTPFRRIAAVPGLPDVLSPEDQALAERWERFFNLGDGELSIDDVPREGLTDVHASSLLDFPVGVPNLLVTMRHTHDYGNLFPDEYLRLTAQVRRKYDASPKDGFRVHSSPGGLTMAVHVRRGDVSATAHAERFTSNEEVAARIRSVLAAAEGRSPRPSVHLYSEGRPADFGPLQDMDLTFHLNESPFETFHNLVCADVLLTSKSSFSYVAALLSTGTVVYESLRDTSSYHRPLSRWLVAQPGGRLPVTRLRQALGSRR